MMKILFRNVGRTESVFTALLHTAAEEEHFDDNLRIWLQSRASAENDKVSEAPNVIVVDEDHSPSDSSRAPRPRATSKNKNVIRIPEGSAKDVGWPDEDLRR
jgi:hypothetical protein